MSGKSLAEITGKYDKQGEITDYFRSPLGSGPRGREEETWRIIVSNCGLSIGLTEAKLLREWRE